jgi:hypothetical protein
MPVDVAVVCGESTKARRRVSTAAPRRVFLDEGLAFPQLRRAFEVDHLIPLGLGGANTIEALGAPAGGFDASHRARQGSDLRYT